jgi:WD40 repeat protein
MKTFTAAALGQPLDIKFVEVSGMAFTPDGHTLATSGDTGESTPTAVWLWDVSDPSQPAQLSTPPISPSFGSLGGGLDITPNGHILGGVANNAIILWDITNPTEPQTLSQPSTSQSDYYDSMAFSPDGHTLAVGGESTSGDAAVWLWNIENPARLTLRWSALLGNANMASANAVAFSPDSRTLATAFLNGTIYW